MKSRPIGVFDSGVGGLSVFCKLITFLPKENFIYLADQKNCPYGGKNPQEINQLACKNIQFLVKKNAKQLS